MSGIQSTDQRIAELLNLRRKVDAELARLARGRVPRTRRSKFEVPECGTESGFQRHRHYGEPVDDDCRGAHNDHERVQSALRRERARAERVAELYGSGIAKATDAARYGVAS